MSKTLGTWLNILPHELLHNILKQIVIVKDHLSVYNIVNALSRFPTIEDKSNVIARLYNSSNSDLLSNIRDDLLDELSTKKIIMDNIFLNVLYKIVPPGSTISRLNILHKFFYNFFLNYPLDTIKEIVKKYNITGNSLRYTYACPKYKHFGNLHAAFFENTLSTLSIDKIHYLHTTLKCKYTPHGPYITCLLTACRTGKLNIVKYLWEWYCNEKTSLKRRRRDIGLTPLYGAIYGNKIDIVKYLVPYFINLDLFNYVESNDIFIMLSYTLDIKRYNIYNYLCDQWGIDPITTL